MKVHVWDSYVRRENGNVIHFDIIVPESTTDNNLIYKYGKLFMNSKGEINPSIDAEECQYCHVETPSKEIVDSIKQKGYFILEMEEIPSKLRKNPSRKEIILYLKAHYVDYRFVSFIGVTHEEVESILKTL